MSAETITTTELFETEAYKRNKLIYPHPKVLLEPFVNKVQEILGDIHIDDMIVQVDKESGAGLQDGEDLKSYGRGLITLRFGEELDGLKSTIGLLWAYDIAKAYVKVFFGATASACTNLCIFGADNVIMKSFQYPKVRDEKTREREWKVSCDGIVSHVLYMTEDILDKHVEKFKALVDFMNILKRTNIPNDDIFQFVGQLYLEEVIKGNFDYSTFNEANRLMFDTKHLHRNKALYETAEGADMNMWKFYGALTQRITDGNVDINLVADKTLEITNLVDKYIAQ